MLIAARVAPLTRISGWSRPSIVTHTEPFHISKAIATLDYVSAGRAGVRVQVSARPHEAAHFGRRTSAASPTDSTTRRRQLSAELFDEAADYVEVVRRLWDSWEDDAEIRDVATGRFIDRDKLHYIDFEGEVLQRQGPVDHAPAAAGPADRGRAGATAPTRTGWSPARADVGFVTPRDAGAGGRASSPRSARAAGRRAQPARPCNFADLVVFLDERRRSRRGRKAPAGRTGRRRVPQRRRDLRRARRRSWPTCCRTGGRRAVRVPAAARRAAHDLGQITQGLVPELQRRGRVPTDYEADTLRGLLGLTRPANRYAAA